MRDGGERVIVNIRSALLNPRTAEGFPRVSPAHKSEDKRVQCTSPIQWVTPSSKAAN